MSRTLESVFRPFEPLDAERSDRSAGDRARHRLKVRESIRENIADIIAEESIIGQNREKVIKVPIRGIREYRFVYGDNTPGVGQGNGESQEGQVVGKTKGQGRPTEDRAGATVRHGSRLMIHTSASVWAQSFQRLLAAYFRTTSTQLSQ